MDRLGLEERLVTMLEYQNDTSCMAELQRRDAKESLEKLETLKKALMQKYFG
jgi:hypothetical protein